MTTIDRQSVMESLLRGSRAANPEVNADAVRSVLQQVALSRGGYGFDVHDRAKLIQDDEVAQYRKLYPDAPKRSDYEVKLHLAERDLYPGGVFKGPREERRSFGEAAIEALPSVERNERGGLSVNPGDFAGGLIQGAISQTGQNIASALGTVMRATGNTREAALYDVVREDIARRAPDAEGIAGGAGQVIGGLAPTGPAVLTGSGAKAMMAIYGLTAFGGGVQEYRDTMKERGIDPNTADEIAHGLGAALTEIVAERLGLDGLLKAAPRIGQAVGERVMKGNFKEAAEVIGELAGASAINAAEETLTQVANNARARYGFYGAEGFDPERPITEGVPESAAGGALGGAVAGRLGKFGRDRRLGEYGTGGRFDQDAYERQKAEIQRRVQFQEELRTKAEEAAARLAEARQTREAFVGEQQQDGQELAEVSAEDAVASEVSVTEPEQPSTPQPTRVVDGVAMFNDEQQARDYARSINKKAKPGEQTAEVANMLGSETWTVTVPQPAQRESRGSVTERNRAINRVVNPATDPNYDPTEGMTPEDIRPQQRAMPLAETLDAILNPLDPIATPIEVSEQEVSQDQANEQNQAEVVTGDGQPADAAAPVESPAPSTEAQAAVPAEPVSEQGIEPGPSAQDSRPAVESRTEPRQTEVPPTRDELMARPYREVQQLAKDAGIKANQSKRALAEALTTRTEAERIVDEVAQTAERPVPVDRPQGAADQPAGQVQDDQGTPGPDQSAGEAEAVEQRGRGDDRYTEFRRQLEESPDRNNPNVYVPGKSAWEVVRSVWVGLQPKPYQERVALGHELAVTQAVRRGENVSPEVLADYPKLAKQQENRLQRIGQSLIDRAEQRMKDRGTRLSMNPLPEAVDVLVWGAGHVIKGVGNLQQFSQLVRDRWGQSTYTPEQIEDIYEESKRVAARYVTEQDRRPVKTQVREATGQTDTSPVVQTNERKALRDRLKNEAKVGEKAFRDGVKSVKATLPDLRKAVRDAQKLKDKAREDRIDGIRKQIRRMVEAELPTSLHGKFLPELTNAKTVNDLVKAIDKMRRELARYDAREAVKSIRKNGGPGALKKYDNETRREIRKLLNEAKPHIETMKAYGKGRIEQGITTNQIAEAAENLTRIEREIAELAAYYEYLRKQYGRDLRQTRDELAAQVVVNVGKSKQRAKSDPGNPLADPSIGMVRGALAGLADSRVMSRGVEGTGDGTGILEYLLVEQMADAEHDYLSARRDLTRALDEIARNAGYTGLSDAMSRTTPQGGRAIAEKVTVTLGGKEVEITTGQAMALYAMDEQTRTLIATGTPIQMSDGRYTDPTAVTIDELDRVGDALTQAQRDMVDAAKALIETTREGTFSAVKQLKGYEPEAVSGYFPRRRNLRQSDKAGLPELGRDGTATRYLENLGFVKEREQGGSSPLVVGDLLSVTMEHLDNAAKLTHLAVPVRDASGVLLQPDVQRAIAAKHGKPALKVLEGNLAAASRANEGIVTDAGKVVSWINGNVASYYMGLNPGSWLKQLGGIPRMVPLIGQDGFRAGVKGAPSVSMETLVNNSGYFWERYVGNISGRFAPTAPDDSRQMVDMTIKDLSKRALDNLLAGDVKAAYNEARSAGLKPLEILNLFDSINARIAWAAYSEQVNRAHPDWDDNQKNRWIARKAADAVRRTQNSSSPIDQTYYGNKQRGSAAAALFLFTSDVARARNRIIEAFQESKKAGSEAMAAEAINFGWAQVSNAVMRGAGVAAAIALMGDWDEFWARVFEAMIPDKRDLGWAFTDTIGYVFPYVLPDAAEAMFTGFGASAFNAPAGGAIDDVLLNAGSAGREFIDAFTDDEFDPRKMLRSMEKAISSGLGVFGLNPAGSPYNRIRREMDKIRKAQEERTPMPL